MDYSSSFYLLNSKKRLEYLQKVINGRPVAILAAGPSIKELEKRVKKLRNMDICYFGMNSFFIQEEHILKQIGQYFSIIMAGANRGLPLILNNLTNFLNRSENNLFISSFFESQFDLLGPNFELNKFLSKYDQKLLFIGISTNQIVPNISYPLHFPLGNTLAQMIFLAIIGGSSKIILFGADGAISKNEIYYDHYRSQESEAHPERFIILDTYRHFNPVIQIGLKNIYRTYGMKPIEILNCSENSHYTPFPTISYDHAIAYLTGQEKYNSSWDTRPNSWIRLWHKLVLYQLPQAKKIVVQWVRYVIKLILPRSLFLVLHRQLQRSRHFYHRTVKKG